MSVDHDARREAIRVWREFTNDPERLEDLRRHATDLLCDHFNRIGDREIDALDEAERAGYIGHLADSLAPDLLRYIGFWVLNDFPTIEDWRGLDP